MSWPDRLVGRDRVLAGLRRMLDEAAAGTGQFALLTGPAGIGKTALAAELIRIARPAGFAVCWAACRAGPGAPPFWPWTQVTRSLGPAAPGLTDLFRRTGSAPTDGDPTGSRFELFADLVAGLTTAAAATPVLLIFDDLQWSDESSLRAMQFAVPQLRTAPVMVVGTHRDDEPNALLIELGQEARVVALEPLTPPEIADVLAADDDPAPDGDVVRSVYERTGGNPFFVREVHRAALSRGGWASYAVDDPDLPAGVRATLTARLDGLPVPVLEALRTAAVIGRDFDTALPARVSGRSIPEMRALFDAAVAAGVVTRTPSAGLMRFAHDLFRETVVAGTVDAPARHLAVGRALADSAALGAPVAAAELAMHFQAAVTLAPDEAVRHSTAAGVQAAAQLAFEDACMHFEQALEALQHVSAVPAAQPIELRLTLGRVLLDAGRSDRARREFLAAAALARSAAEPALLAEAALGVDALGVRAGHVPTTSIALLEEAAAKMAGTSTPVRARLLAALSRELHHSLRPEALTRSVALAAEAVQLSRDAADPETVAHCLLAQHDASWVPGSASARLPILDELIEQATAAGNRELAAEGVLLRAAALLEQGDPAGRRELDRYCQAAASLGSARGRYGSLTRRATLESIAGENPAALELAQQAQELGVAIGIPDAAGVAGAQAWMLSRFAEVSSLSSIFESASGSPIDLSLRLLGRWLTGDRGAALRAEAASYRREFVPRTHDLEPLAMLAEVMAEVGPVDFRSWLYDELAPHAGVGVVIGGCASYLGVVDHLLGLLARSLDRPHDAREHFGAAAAVYQRLGARAWSDLVANEMSRAEPLPAPVFRRDGAVWELRFDGVTARVPDAKGLGDLHLLVSAPGREVAVRELLGVTAPAPGSDDVLDAQARAQYRRRIEDLDAAIDDAAVAGDAARAEAARAEREFLVAELVAATGLGGRARRLGDVDERLRKTVTARIRYAIDRLRPLHPALADHFAAAIRTGHRCSYRPEVEVRWEL